MKVLGLDTATLTSGIALLDEDRVLAEARHDASARTADLLVAIDAACKQAGVAPADLDAVAVGAGPGSFTGLRIGMATAKGIAFAAGVPLWAVSSLAALAWDASALHGDGTYVAALDARRGEVFAGCYRATGAELRLLGDERVLAPSLLAAITDDPEARFAGDAIDAHAAALAPLAARWLAPRTPSGVAVARLALSGTRVDVLVSGGPTYIRPSEAEVMYPDGVPGALRKRDP